MPDWIDTLITVIFVLTAVIMTFLILLQEGKGGGLAALGGTKAAGIEGVTNPIRRATGYLGAIFFILAIMLGVMHRPRQSVGDTTFAAPAVPTDTTEATTVPETKAEEPKTAPVPAPATTPAVETKAAAPQAGGVTTPPAAKPAEPAKAVEAPKAPADAAPEANKAPAVPKADAPKAAAPAVP